jgi:molybdate transport system substrate-binding protein
VRRTAVPILGAVALLAVSGCGSDDDNGSSGRATLTVYAASSLTSTFTSLGKDFESAHPGVTVRFSFGGSSDLVAQLQQGAPADVFASADTATMDKATSDGLVAGSAVPFASNTLEIAVPPDNPAHVGSLADLADPDVTLIVCAPEVPCGAAVQKVASAAQVSLSPVSEEASVTDVLAKVESGEADAGLVYVTDVRAAGDKVLGIEFPESKDAVNVYPIASLRDSEDPTLAKQFVAEVTGAHGRQVLRAAGFARP